MLLRERRLRNFVGYRMGFLSPFAVPKPKGQTLNQGIEEMLATFDSLAPNIHPGPLLFCSYHGWVADPTTQQLLPLANVVSAYPGNR
jgi:hypothetical protein